MSETGFPICLIAFSGSTECFSDFISKRASSSGGGNMSLLWSSKRSIYSSTATGREVIVGSHGKTT